MEVTSWIYSPEKMNLREQCLSVLLRRYGSELNPDGSSKYSSESIFNCAHDWVSHGNPKTDGIVKYYEAYFKNGQGD